MRLHLGTRSVERTIESLGVEYVNKFIQYVPRKSSKLQNLERTGKIEFGKGLYHNESYEILIKGLVESHSEYLNTKDIDTRKTLANQQYDLWKEYINSRMSVLPDEMQTTFSQNLLEMKSGIKTKIEDETQFMNNAKRIFDTFSVPSTISSRNSAIKPENLQEAIFNLASLFKFHPVIGPEFMNQMFGDSHGYLVNLENPIEQEYIFDLWKILTVATFEKLSGQDLLAQEISSFGFWRIIGDNINCFDLQKEEISPRGWVNDEDFLTILKTVRAWNFENKDINNARKEFLLDDLEFFEKESGVIRFDAFRNIWLQRNL